MRRILFSFFIFILSLSYCFSLEIRGKVITIEGKPVKDVIILHRLSQKETTTDTEGFFSLDVPEGKRIRLEIIHPDYIEQEILISQQHFSKKITVTLLPYIRQKEEVVVTALRHPEVSSSIPAAETVIPKETLEEKMVPNIASGLLHLPGLSNIGSGGFSVVPNIRGLARRRVLILIDNARVTSDRRTGPNASFVNPLDIEKIEVLRSPSSVFYGSDAIGGVIHILTKKTSLQESIKGKINMKFGTVNLEKTAGISLQATKGKTGFYLSFRGTDAENYSSPYGEVLQSQFTTSSLFSKISYQSEKRDIHLSYLGARGFNIGKPNRDSEIQPTWYPIENQNLLQLSWLEKEVGNEGDISFHLYLNPHYLETKKEKIKVYKTEESFSRTQSLDFGFQVSLGKRFSQYFRLKGGTDFFGRFKAKAQNKNTYFDSSGSIEKVTEEFPFTKGKRQDLGFFLSFDYTGIKRLDLVGGLRYDVLKMQATPGSVSFSQKSSHRAWTGFLGATFKMSEVIVAFANLSRAYRAPSLSESFYSGITGRGFVIGKPDLRSETSFCLDAGLKFIHTRYFAALYLFHYKIDDMVERFRSSEKIYTYGNIEKGRIQGIELEIEYFPFPGWKIFGNLYSFRGISQVTGDPLNDLPPSRLFIGTRVWRGHFWAELNGNIQWNKKNPGPAEISIPGYETVNLQAGYLLDSSLRLYFSISNLLNRSYVPRPDPDALEVAGRNFILGLSYVF
ncbi:MAG: TonB-dependent receptor domain-containing protein [Candidatus Aminicenantaceae bacterium]